MTLYDLVKKLLTDYAVLRDSDKKLIWTVWYKQGLCPNGVITKEDFLNAEIEESITRARRQVQKDFPELKSSPHVEEARKRKEEEKGTFVYRKEVPIPTVEVISKTPEVYLNEMKKLFHK